MAPNELPRKQQYLALRQQPPGNIGLVRDLHHSTVSGAPRLKGRERESHHITQFLLIEYFHDSSNVHPFQHLTEHEREPVYPGLESQGGEIQRFRKSSSQHLEIEGLFGNRGGNMPAILLAKTTHRTGRLHVTSRAEDFGTGVSTPAQAVHAVFRERLGRGTVGQTLIHQEAAGAAALRTYAEQNESQVKDRIFVAMRQTYAWMRDYMQPRLKSALRRIERTYYNELANQDGSSHSDQLSESDLDGVWRAAVDHNRQILAPKGWEET